MGSRTPTLTSISNELDRASNAWQTWTTQPWWPACTTSNELVAWGRTASRSERGAIISELVDDARNGNSDAMLAIVAILSSRMIAWTRSRRFNPTKAIDELVSVVAQNVYTTTSKNPGDYLLNAAITSLSTYDQRTVPVAEFTDRLEQSNDLYKSAGLDSAADVILRELASADLNPTDLQTLATTFGERTKRGDYDWRAYRRYRTTVNKLVKQLDRAAPLAA